MHCLVRIIILSYRPEQEKLQHHNNDTKDEETIPHVEHQDTENTKERTMMLNAYDDTEGYVDS